MKRLVLVFCFVFLTFIHAEDYQFIGRHLIVSYLDCDVEAIEDENQLKEVMKMAAKASGVTILSSSEHHFEPMGLTQVLLLSESHASIHTYPENRACFVDLFTCGTSWEMEKFDEVLTKYLKPLRVSHKFLLREDKATEIAFNPIQNLN